MDNVCNRCLFSIPSKVEMAEEQEYRQYLVVYSDQSSQWAFELVTIWKATWKSTGTLTERKTKGQTSPSRIIMNNKTFTNKLDIAEQFNKYFINDEEPSKYTLI